MKFKLSKNDAKSLENSAELISNPVLRKGIIDVTNSPQTGGTADWVKVNWVKRIGVAE